jgi:tetratricopeptide (TPR) repeat protein
MYVRIAALWLLCPAILVCSDTFDDLKQQADAARAAHNPAAAIPLYERALQLNKLWPEGWWDLGNMYYVSGQYAPAREAMHQLTELQPQLGEGWGMQGMAAMQQGAYADALQAMDKSLALKFDVQPAMRDIVLTNRALLLSKLGKFDEALTVLYGFARGGQPDPALINAIGIAALRRPWLPADIPPQQNELIKAAGNAELAILAHRADAAQLVNEVARSYSNAPGVHYLAGYIAFASDVKQAKAQFRKELEIAPDDVGAASMLGYSMVIDHDDDLASAERLTRRAVDSDPTNAGYEYALGRVLDEKGDHIGAVTALETAAKIAPDNVEYHVALAVACEGAGRSSEAIAERKRALALRFGQSG